MNASLIILLAASLATGMQLKGERRRLGARRVAAPRAPVDEVVVPAVAPAEPLSIEETVSKAETMVEAAGKLVEDINNRKVGGLYRMPAMRAGMSKEEYHALCQKVQKHGISRLEQLKSKRLGEAREAQEQALSALQDAVLAYIKDVPEIPEEIIELTLAPEAAERLRLAHELHDARVQLEVAIAKTEAAKNRKICNIHKSPCIRPDRMNERQIQKLLAEAEAQRKHDIRMREANKMQAIREAKRAQEIAQLSYDQALAAHTLGPVAPVVVEEEVVPVPAQPEVAAPVQLRKRAPLRKPVARQHCQLRPAVQRCQLLNETH